MRLSRGVRLACILLVVPMTRTHAQRLPTDATIDSLWAADPAASLAAALVRLRRAPNDHPALWRAARAEATAGILSHEPQAVKAAMYRRGADYARRAIAVGPADATSHYWLAAALGRHAMITELRESARLADATLAAARATIAADSLFAGGHAILGRLHAEARALPLPIRILAGRLFGVQSVREASWETGELELRRAVALDPKAVGYRLDLALLLVRRERWDDAYAELKTAQALPIRSVLDSALMYEIGGKVLNAHRTRRAP